MSEALRAKARVTTAENRGGIPDPDLGFSSIRGNLFGFVAFKECLMLGFYPAERCRMSVVRYKICQYR